MFSGCPTAGIETTIQATSDTAPTIMALNAHRYRKFHRCQQHKAWTWDDLLRLAATIRLKEETASNIFRRLNSYSRQLSLYVAMKAFGQMIKSLLILRYIVQVELRQAIEKQLNRIELANSFTRAVAVGNPCGLEYGEKAEQELAEGCTRLIKNSVICWNYLYLTRQVEAARSPEERERLRRMIWLPPVMGAVQPARGVRFLERQTAEQHRRAAPQNRTQDHRRKLGAAKSVKRQLSLGETKNPMKLLVPMCA